MIYDSIRRKSKKDTPWYTEKYRLQLISLILQYFKHSKIDIHYLRR